MCVDFAYTESAVAVNHVADDLSAGKMESVLDYKLGNLSGFQVFFSDDFSAVPVIMSSGLSVERNKFPAIC